MVNLALLWHMHQPFYQDLATGEHILPWVRLHAIKDYWGMVALLDEFPAVRVTFNLVPSLVAQVEEFAADRARDRHLELGLKPAAGLTDEEARWVVANGFHAPYGRMIAPFPRYAELHALRRARQPFDEAQLRDLQVWHKLVWIDPDYQSADKRVRALIDKGHAFTEADKGLLRDIELELLRRVVPAYRDASRRGQIELSTSPFYHPILPLLVNSDVHLVAHPHANRPRTRFTRPGDARAQIERAIAFHESRFGSRPRGMWPSEGSVSDEAIALIAKTGLDWIATDEDILARSLGVSLPRDAFGHAERPDILYRPYRVTANGPVALFRDHTLSDRVGFHYQSWDAVQAADDFVARVREAGRRFTQVTGGEVGTVCVILDGENAWEHYAGGGRPFLRALYARLGAASDIRTMTFTEAATGAAPTLPAVYPGSWINADFYIWIGHRDDHRAWSQLADACAEFDRRAGAASLEAREHAFEELLIAEGSDWFWWYGDDHSSDHDREFDELFRRHLRNAYAALESAVPDELYVSNITTGAHPDRLAPEDLLPIALDGRDTSYLEWMGAARAPLSKPTGAMHEVSPPTSLSEVLVGVAAGTLCLRLAGPALLARLVAGDVRLSIATSAPEVRHIPIEDQWLRIDTAAEVAIPFDVIGVGPEEDLAFCLQVLDASGSVIESLPVGGSWLLPGRASRAQAWRA